MHLRGFLEHQLTILVHAAPMRRPLVLGPDAPDVAVWALRGGHGCRNGKHVTIL